MHCRKTLNSKLFVLRVVYLCVAHLFTIIIKAENININGQKTLIVKNFFNEIRKGIKGLYKKEVETRLGHE